MWRFRLRKSRKFKNRSRGGPESWGAVEIMAVMCHKNRPPSGESRPLVARTVSGGNLYCLVNMSLI